MDRSNLKIVQNCQGTHEPTKKATGGWKIESIQSILDIMALKMRKKFKATARRDSSGQQRSCILARKGHFWSYLTL